MVTNYVQLVQHTHLGLERSDKQESEINIEERIKTSRRTKYSLMSSGLHGTNGIDPTTSYNIYKLYVLPRLLYGLEILALKTRDIEKLDRFHKDTLRQFQSLPKRAAISSVYLLLGALPIEAELHKRRQLSFLYIYCYQQKMSSSKVLIERQLCKF